MSAERVARMPADDWRKRDAEFRAARLARHQALARLLGEIGQRHGGRSAAEVAIAWTLANPAVTAAIVGGRSPEQVDGFAGAMNLHLTRDDLAQIDAFRSGRP